MCAVPIARSGKVLTWGKGLLVLQCFMIAPPAFSQRRCTEEMRRRGQGPGLLAAVFFVSRDTPHQSLSTTLPVVELSGDPTSCSCICLAWLCQYVSCYMDCWAVPIGLMSGCRRPVVAVVAVHWLFSCYGNDRSLPGWPASMTDPDRYHWGRAGRLSQLTGAVTGCSCLHCPPQGICIAHGANPVPGMD